MKLNREQLIGLTECSVDAARAAGRLISEYAEKEIKIGKKAGGDSLASQVVTEVDRLSQDLILEKLLPTLAKYDLGMLTEESEDDQSRFSKDHFWCIDPLDGTLCFAEKRDGYSVSIALVSQEGLPLAGVVVNPVDQTVYHAIKGEGAFKNGERIRLNDFSRSKNNFSLVCDPNQKKHEHFEHRMNLLREKVNALGYEKLSLVQSGGAVMNACRVLENAPACFFKLPKKTEGGGSIWDYAATTCIFNELEVFVSDMQGGPLDLNQKSPFMNEKGVIFCTDQRVWEILVEI